jgi:uncharacterized protein (TIGR02300 family)
MALGAPPIKQQRRRPALAKPEWGSKRVCQNCGTKFYDFHREPILCPSCGATYQADDALKPRRSRVEPKGRAAAKPAPAEEEDEAAAEEEAEDILLDEADEEEEDEVEEAVVEEDEDDEAEAEVKVGKPVRDPLIPDDEVEDDDALDEEIDEDEDEDVDEDFADDEKEP